MKVTIVLQNVAHGGWDSDGRDRWPLLAARIGDAVPDVVLLNECAGWARRRPRVAGRKNHRLRHAAADLGLTALPLPPSNSGYGPAMLYRRDTLGTAVAFSTDFWKIFEHGVAVAAWDLGLPAPFAVAVTHIAPFSPTKARIEAETLGVHACRYGPYAVVGADFNFPPLYGPRADHTRMGAGNIARRFNDPLADPPAVPNTDVAQILANDRFHDSFAVLHRRTGDDRLLQPTGKTDRIDWIMVSDPVKDAIIGGRVLDTPAGASDHHGVAVTIDTALITPPPAKQQPG